MEIEIIKYQRGKDTWYKPAVSRNAIFEHCSGGFMEVIERKYVEDVFPLLLLHGQKVIEIVE